MIQSRIQELFGRKLAKHKVAQLIQIAEEVDVDLEAMIHNTYKYHTQVEKCRNIFGTIKYALENGGWDISKPSDEQKHEAHCQLPRAVRESIENPCVESDVPDPELLVIQERVLEKLRRLDEKIAMKREREDSRHVVSAETCDHLAWLDELSVLGC